MFIGTDSFHIFTIRQSLIILLINATQCDLPTVIIKSHINIVTDLLKAPLGAF
jgi:hypothetical protein